MKRRVKILLLVALIMFLLGKFVLSPYVVVGTSMMPTLRDMDLCLMRRTWHYRPARGDIVVFRTADAPPLRFVKRVCLARRNNQHFQRSCADRRRAIA